MSSALVGHTGFVGQNILAARPFPCLFNSKNSTDMTGRAFSEVWFAGLPGTKWAANKDGDGDLRNLRAIQRVVDTIECDRFVLISTIDVRNDHEPYGRHRRMFEDWVRDRFGGSCIVRLPGIFGRGLKKNVIYDLLTGTRTDQIHVEDAFQWYDLAELVADIARAQQADLLELDLYTEPVANRALLKLFPEVRTIAQSREPRRDHFPSAQADLFGGERYVRTADEVVGRIGSFLDGVRAGTIPVG